MSERRAAILAGLAVGAVALLAFGPVTDPDLGFHLATARAVLRDGAIPATNVLSFAAPDAIAVNQQWLPAVLLELCWRAGGAPAVVALRVLTVAVTFAVVLATARALGARPSAALVSVVLAASAAAFRFVDRPLLASNLTSALTVLGLVLATTPARRRAGLVLVGVASFVGPQLHAGAVFGLLAVVLWSLADAVPQPLWARVGLPLETRSKDVRAALAPLGAAAAGLGAAMALLFAYHPHPLRVLAVPFQMGSDPFLHAHLVEYRVPWDQPLALLLPYWVFVAALALVLARYARRQAVLPAGLLAVAALGVAASLAYARFADMAAIFGAPCLAVGLERIAVEGRAVRAAGALAIVALGARLWVVPPAAPELSPVTWPLALDAVARREHLVGPAFVQDGWAGPFLGLHFPEERVFFHPAFDAYPPGFYRDVYLATRDGAPGWDATLDRFGVELVFMKHTSPRERERQRGAPNLRQRLAASPAWALVAFDDLGAIFVRRAGVNAEAARRLAIDGVDPDRLALAGDRARARAGLDALAARGLPSRRLDVLRGAARGER